MPISTLIQRTLFIAVGAPLIVFSPSDVVQAAAIDFTAVDPKRDFTNELSWTLGFTFRTNQEITVTHLGFYDDRKDGLTEAHSVKLLDAADQVLGDEVDQILVEGTVRPTDPLISWFRYTQVTPTVLAAGRTFRIVAITGSERYTWNPVGFVVDPAITFLGDTFQPITSPLSQPELQPATPLAFTSGGVTGWFGPNFQFEVTPIPTPALLPGLIGMGMAVWRKRQQVGE